MALSTGVPGFLGTHRFSLICKETHQIYPKTRKSTTRNPSIRNADKAPAQANFFENVFLYRDLFRYSPEYHQTKKFSQKGLETHSTPRRF